MIQRTFTYKSVNDCDINLDLYVNEFHSNTPTVIWIHGGALIFDDRRDLPRKYMKPLLEAGFAFVSIDYRLAPETKLPNIVQDVIDAIEWVRNEGPSIYGADARNTFLFGRSAGGYLALLAGQMATPPVNAVTSFYGYGDISGEWYTKPSEFYLSFPEVKKEVALESVGIEQTSTDHSEGVRNNFYIYCRQNGTWPNEISGFTGPKYDEQLRAYCPIYNFNSESPPTLLAHGTNDTDVPYDQSVLIKKALDMPGVFAELITLPNAGHGFVGASAEDLSGLVEKPLEFFNKYLRK